MPDDLVATLRAAGCVFAEEEADLLLATARDEAHLTHMLHQRTTGLPLEHVLGWATFHGHRIEVDPGVFVPRRRTEALVTEAIALLPTNRPVVVDLCCGSGALGVAVSSGADVELFAADVDAAAVACARRNVEPIGGQVFEGDLLKPLPSALKGRVNILLANVPYVPSDEVRLLPTEARLHEPLVTLDGGSDGLGIFRRVSAEAGEWLAPGGHLLVETSEDQCATAQAILKSDGLTPRVVTDSDYGATVVIGTRSTA